MTELNQCHHIPDAFYAAHPEQLADILGGPTLFKLSGDKQPPLFVSTLLHGNETTGLRALQELLTAYRKTRLPRSLILFIGNVQAAQVGKRSMPEGVDYNRIWKVGLTPEHRLAEQVKQATLGGPLFAAIDIHNTTGRNPHYSLLCKTGPEEMQLAALFHRNAVKYEQPDTTLTCQYADHTPSITLECGPSGNAATEAGVAQYLRDILHIDHLSTHSHAARDVNVYRMFGRFVVPDDVDLEIDGQGSIAAAPQGQGKGLLRLRHDLDLANFRALEPGEVWGNHNILSGRPLEVELDHPEHSGYFHFDNGLVTIAKSFVPAMLTLDTEVIRKDCLGYLLRRIKEPSKESKSHVAKPPPDRGNEP